jgi:hypothetical protein
LKRVRDNNYWGAKKAEKDLNGYKKIKLNKILRTTDMTPMPEI